MHDPFFHLWVIELWNFRVSGLWGFYRDVQGLCRVLCAIFIPQEQIKRPTSNGPGVFRLVGLGFTHWQQTELLQVSSLPYYPLSTVNPRGPLKAVHGVGGVVV